MNTKFSGYKVAVGTSLALFAHIGVMATLGVFLPEISSGLGQPLSRVGLVLTFSSIIAFVSSLFVGRLLVKFSPKYLLLLGAFTCLIQCIIYGSANSLIILYCASIIEGFTTGLATITAASAVVKQWFIDKRSLVIGYVMGGAMIGSALFITLAGYLIQSIGYRYAYFVLGVVAFAISGLSNIILIKKSPENVGEVPLGYTEDSSDLNKEIINEGITMKKALRTPSFWLIILFGAVFSGLSLGFPTYAPSFWQYNGMDSMKSAVIITVFSILAVIATMVSGTIAEKTNNKVYVSYLHIAYILSLVFAIISKTNINGVAMYLSIIFAAIAYPIYTALISTITTEIFGSKDYEKITGYFMAAMYIGLCLVSPLCGGIQSATNSFVPAFIMLIIIAIISLVTLLIAIIKKPY